MRNRTYGGVGGGRKIPAPYPISNSVVADQKRYSALTETMSVLRFTLCFLAL